MLRGHDLGPDIACDYAGRYWGRGFGVCGTTGRQAPAQDIRVTLIPNSCLAIKWAAHELVSSPFVEMYKLYQTTERISYIRLKC